MSEGWFVGLDPDDTDAAATAINEGEASEPQEWPAAAVEADFAADSEGYYERLRTVTRQAASEAARAAEQRDDQQLIHAVRAMDDCLGRANELAERVAEWAGSLDADAQPGIEGARDVAAGDPETPTEQRLVGLAATVVDLADQAEDLRAYVERTTPEVAPNLAALAGPVLAARLISLAGGLETLAKQPSGTLQVLGAEEALFAHLRGGAPSPKHGVIYTHAYIQNTAPDERGSAARALAGKLTIAARVDHYSGDRRPELDEELDERIERIRERSER